MTLRYYYRDNDGDVVEIVNPSRVRRGGTEASYQAEEGAVGAWELEVDDPDGTFNVRGYRIVYAQEDEALADDQHGIVWVGYTGERYVSRMGGDSPAKRTEAGRTWRVGLHDLNTRLSWRMNIGNDCDRPAETDLARIAWLMGTSEMSWLDDDTTYIDTDDPFDLDAVDLTGQTLLDVCDDAAQSSGRNYFLLWEYSGDEDDPVAIKLWYKFGASDDYPSEKKLNNYRPDVEADPDAYYPSLDATLNRSPSRVAWGVNQLYDGGQIYATLASTAERFNKVDVTGRGENVKTAASAQLRAQRYLATVSNAETDRIEVSVIVEPADVNSILPGHNLAVHFTHLPGYGLRDDYLEPTYVWMRVVERTVRDIAPGWYELGLTLMVPAQDDFPADEGGGDVDSHLDRARRGLVRSVPAAVGADPVGQEVARQRHHSWLVHRRPVRLRLVRALVAAVPRHRGDRRRVPRGDQLPRHRHRRDARRQRAVCRAVGAVAQRRGARLGDDGRPAGGRRIGKLVGRAAGQRHQRDVCGGRHHRGTPDLYRRQREGDGDVPQPARHQRRPELHRHPRRVPAVSTPTRYQQWTQPILNEHVGYSEPQEPDPDPEDPTDYASVDEAGAVQTPLTIGGGAVTIVNNTRILTQSVDPDWSGDFTPTAGNVLLVYTFQRNGGLAAAPTGWVRLEEINSTDSIACYGRVSDGTERSMDYDIGTAAARDYVIIEVSGVTLADIETNTNSGSSTSITTGSVTPTAGVPAIIIGAAAAFPDEILGQSYTPGAGYTEMYDSTGTAHPFETVIYDIEASTAGSYNPATTINNLAIGHAWIGLTVSLAEDTDVVWQPAPAVNDGDTATSELVEIDTDPVMRIALAVERLIYRIELDVGQASSGSTVYELYGTDDPEFVSTTLLATLTFTATGSYTLDTVEGAWVPTASYAYYELVHVSGGGVDREFFEVRLFSANSSIGVTVHGALTGRDMDDQHPADAVSYDNGTSGLTADDVQAAIDEVVAAGGSGLTVEDEGTPLATAATTLDFVGGGVVASGTGATKTITISAGGSSELARVEFTGNVTINQTAEASAVSIVSAGAISFDGSTVVDIEVLLRRHQRARVGRCQRHRLPVRRLVVHRHHRLLPQPGRVVGRGAHARRPASDAVQRIAHLLDPDDVLDQHRHGQRQHWRRGQLHAGVHPHHAGIAQRYCLTYTPA